MGRPFAGGDTMSLTNVVTVEAMDDGATHWCGAMVEMVLLWLSRTFKDYF